MDTPFLLFGFALLVFAILFLFLNLGFSVVLFIISFGLIAVHYQIPKGKAEVAKAQAEKLALAELKKSVEVRTKELSSNPSDVASLEYILTTLDTFSKGNLKSLYQFNMKEHRIIEPVSSCERRYESSVQTGDR